MSDADRPRQTSKPGRSKQAQRRRTAGPSDPSPPSGKRSASRKKRQPSEAGRPRPPLPKRSWRDRLLNDARTGGPGLGVSLCVHAAIILLFWLVVVGGRGAFTEDPALEVGWLPASATRADAEADGPLDIPVEINQPQPAKTPVEDPQADKQDDPSDPAPSSTARPVSVGHLLDGRDRSERGRMLERYGGSDATERAVETGLMWIDRQQRSAGNWSLHRGYPDAGTSTMRTGTGATALALLAFLGTGHTHMAGEHPETVRRGLKWLTGVQKPNGDFHDHLEIGRPTAFYAHSMATIALCEAYAMSGDETLREPAEAGVAYLVETQQPIDGGWKYRPQHETTVGDLSVTGWALMALHTARVAGLDVPQETFDLSARFLDSVQERQGARYKYQPDDPPERVTVTMTAEGLLCRQYLGWPADLPAMQQGVRFLRRQEPRWEEGKRNVYEWYYVGHVMHNVGGEAWKNWYRAVQREIVDNQVRYGPNRGPKDIRGSWDPVDPVGSPHEYSRQAGRLYITAMCILILEMPYRYLPLPEGAAPGSG